MPSTVSTQRLLREMFSEMVVKKDASLVSHYYHPDFLLETNGQHQDYKTFSQGHEKVYATPITYEIRYDEASWVESAESVAVRVWIKTQRPNEDATEFEVVLIAAYVDGKIHRVWELTWPDWTTVKAFKDHS
jgi:hypothetical protein